MGAMGIRGRGNRMGDRVLLLSNGHGEDSAAVAIATALRQQLPTVTLGAMAIVGQGHAYRKAQIPIIGPTASLPSGGFNTIHVFRLLNPLNWGRDTNPLSLLRDLGAGLVGLTWRQLQVVRHYSQDYDLLFAVGDIVPILFAWITGRPFGVFLIATSSYYEGTARLPLLTQWALRSRRCVLTIARDAYTAKDLRQRGFTQVTFVGHPMMDALHPSHRPLAGTGGAAIALLPGSRLPEAAHNLGLMLGLCAHLPAPMRIWAALVPELTPDQVAAVAEAAGWQVEEPGCLRRGAIAVHYYYDRFADILQQCDLVVGMAGTAVEQAVGLGKPIVQIPGPGPQFTYLFAEAQMRLLGPGVQTVGTVPATPDTLATAATLVQTILQDTAYRQECRHQGQTRIGPPGGSAAMATLICQALGQVSPHSPAQDARTLG